MKTDFNIHIGVTVDVTDRLAGCVSRIMRTGSTATPEKPVTGTPTAERAETVKAAVTEKTDPQETGDLPFGDPMPEMTPETKPDTNADTVPPHISDEEAEKATAEIELTPADVRDAIDRARLRIEGEGWESKDTEGYNRYHKQVTGWCRRTAAECSGGTTDKPSELPDNVSRWNFIMQADSLHLAEDGEIAFTLSTPF